MTISHHQFSIMVNETQYYLKLGGFVSWKMMIFFLNQYLSENHNQKNPQLPDLHYSTISSNLTDSLF